jgi:hypothetical protein
MATNWRSSNGEISLNVIQGPCSVKLQILNESTDNAPAVAAAIARKTAFALDSPGSLTRKRMIRPIDEAPMRFGALGLGAQRSKLCPSSK